MRNSIRAFAALSVLSLSSSLLGANALPKVTRTGRYLYTEDGNRFYIKGIAYQAQPNGKASNSFNEFDDFVDNLSDSAGCARDLPNLQKLGVNTIRAYSVDSTLNHDDCMGALSKAGIYTIIDLSVPQNGSLDRNSPSWSTNLLGLYTNTIDVFSKYDNILAYNVGNEVILANGTAGTPYVKAAARDIKAYLKSKGSNALVGYAAIDGSPDFKDPLSNYLSCDPSDKGSDSTAIDIFGLNNYEWCGESSFESSYTGINGNFAGYNVAAYFSEYGCITKPPRLWTEAGALFSSQMSDIWSGGIAFSYFPRISNDGDYGLVTISDDGKTATTNSDFDALVEQYGKITSPPNTPSKSSASDSTYPSCPTSNSTFLASTTLPPTPNAAACDCLESILSCRFTPAISDYKKVAGTLLDTGCSLLGEKGLSCDEIGGDGAKGVYGRISGCDPTIKLSYVMSQYYEANNRDAQACSFAGNGTVNTAAPSGVSDANAAASSCLANPDATFVPSAAPSNAPGSSNGGADNGGKKGGDSSKDNAAAGSEVGALGGLGAMVVVAVGSAVWTLL